MQWGDEIKFTHGLVEIKSVKLDDKSSPLVALIELVEGAARIQIQNGNKTASRSPPKGCIVVSKSAVAYSGVNSTRHGYNRILGSNCDSR